MGVTPLGWWPVLAITEGHNSTVVIAVVAVVVACISGGRGKQQNCCGWLWWWQWWTGQWWPVLLTMVKNNSFDDSGGSSGSDHCRETTKLLWLWWRQCWWPVLVVAAVVDRSVSVIMEGNNRAVVIAMTAVVVASVTDHGRNQRNCVATSISD